MPQVNCFIVGNIYKYALCNYFYFCGTSGLFDDLDMDSIASKKEAASRLVSLARKEGINVPTDEIEARTKFGTLLMGNQDKSPGELLSLAENMFGTIQKDNKQVTCRLKTYDINVFNRKKLAKWGQLVMRMLI